MPDFARVAYFTYKGSDSNTYKGLEINKYELDKKLMLNQTANPDNKKYSTEITGTANLRVALGAPVIATKGHFYQIADEAKDKVAKIFNKKGEQLLPDPAIDETEMGVEKTTGVSMIAKQRLQMNFQIEKDPLFSFLQSDYIITPLTFVRRESVFTDSQAEDILGAIIIAKKVKIAFTVIFCLIGVGLFILAAVMIVKYKKIVQDESLGILEVEDNPMSAPLTQKKDLHRIQHDSQLERTTGGDTLIESKEIEDKRHYLR